MAGGTLAIAALLGGQIPELPEDKGKATVLRRCVGCHEIGEVVGARRTEIGWMRNVADMVSRGTEGSDEEMLEVVAYLTRHFGKINVNTASPAQLREVLGLSEEEAHAIVAHRERAGQIRDFEQLKAIPGANPEKLQDKRALIAFSL